MPPLKDNDSLFSYYKQLKKATFLNLSCFLAQSKMPQACETPPRVTADQIANKARCLPLFKQIIDGIFQYIAQFCLTICPD